MFRIVITFLFILYAIPSSLADLATGSVSKQAIKDHGINWISEDAIVIAAKLPPPKPRKPVSLKKAKPKAKAKPSQSRKKPRVSKVKPKRAAKAKSATKKRTSVSGAAKLANVKKVAVNKKAADNFSRKVKSSTAALAKKPLTRTRFQQVRKSLHTTANNLKISKGSSWKLLNNQRASRSKITKSSLNRVKNMVKYYSDNSKIKNPMSQNKFNIFKRIVERAGGSVRIDPNGIRGTSAGKNHAQISGLGKSLVGRHVWLQPGVR